MTQYRHEKRPNLNSIFIKITVSDRGCIITTIAFKDGILTADSRGTIGNLVAFDDFEKVCRFDSHEYGDVFVGFAGAVNHIAEAQRFLHNLFSGIPNDSIKFDFDQMQMLMLDELGDIYEGMLTEASTDISWLKLEAPCAIGSGSQIAIGAMEAGASAEDAVRIAGIRDCFSGGTVRTYHYSDLAYIAKLKRQRDALDNEIKIMEEQELAQDIGQSLYDEIPSNQSCDTNNYWFDNMGVIPCDPNDLVEVLFHNGETDTDHAGEFRWSICDSEFDIVEWRHSEEQV